MLYKDPNTAGALVEFQPKYGNFINGAFLPPTDGRYFDAITPVTGVASLCICLGSIRHA